MLNHNMKQLYNLVVGEVYGKVGVSREDVEWHVLDRPLSAEVITTEGKTVTLADCIEETKKKYAQLKNSAPEGAATDVERACGLENNILQPQMSNGRMQIHLSDMIMPGFGANLADLIECFGAAGETPSDIYINSPGGSVTEGRAMQNAILRQRANAEVIAHVDGVCGSAATTVALGCTRTTFSRGSIYVIHNTHGIFGGDRHSIAKLMAYMLKEDTCIASDYAEVTGETTERMMQYMDEETRFTAQEAEAMGFCNGLSTNGYDGGLSNNVGKVIDFKSVKDPQTYLQAVRLLT